MVQLDLRKRNDLSNPNLNHMNPLKSESSPEDLKHEKDLTGGKVSVTEDGGVMYQKSEWLRPTPGQ